MSEGLNKHDRRLRSSGFTIIELLVVVLIIGLLTSVAVASFITAQRHARDNARKATVNTIANAVESYYAAKHAFPGKMNVSVNGQPDPSKQDPAGKPFFQNCEQTDSHGDYLYYFYPLDVNDQSGTVNAEKTPCSRRGTYTNGKYTYEQADYSPFPAWIPGLAPYLSPFPEDGKFLDKDGNPSGTFADVLGAADDPVNGVTNLTRTFVYRHLDGGYAVYTRLESVASDDDALDGTSSPKTFSDTPKPFSGTPLSVTGRYIYMVRK